MIGHGGVMPMPSPGVRPNVADHNRSRTRMWATIDWVFESNRWQMKWVFQESIFGHAPTFDRWLGKNHFHNYGATVFRNPDMSYARDSHGNLYLLFDAVSEERDGLPYVTDIFIARLDPSFTRIVGAPRKLLSTLNSRNGRPYRASLRDGGRAGRLREGARPLLIRDSHGKSRWIVFTSGGNYVDDKYSINAAISAGEDPTGPYTDLVDKDGELIDLAALIRCIQNGTWGPARFSPFYAHPSDFHSGEFWGGAHVIFKDEIQPRDVKSGWPRTAAEFNRRHRRTELLPFRVVEGSNGLLSVELDARDASPLFRKAERRCKTRLGF